MWQNIFDFDEIFTLVSESVKKNWTHAADVERKKQVKDLICFSNSDFLLVAGGHTG